MTAGGQPTTEPSVQAVAEALHRYESGSSRWDGCEPCTKRALVLADAGLLATALQSAADTEHERWVAAERLRDKIDRNLDDIAASDAGKRCIVCAHVKHNDLGYCQVGQCSCAVGTSLAGTARVVSRDLADLLNRQAAEVARLGAVVTAVRKVHRPEPVLPHADECGHPEDSDHELTDSGNGMLCVAAGAVAQACAECRDEDGSLVDFPCDTRRALDGGAVS